MKPRKSSLLTFPVFIIPAAIAAAALFASSVSAQLIGYDDAGEYLLTANWTNGANQGFGFMPWVILTNNITNDGSWTPPGNEGWYINTGTPYANESITNVGGTNYSCVWGIYANGTNAVNQTTAFRAFSNTLGTNTFKIQWGAREAGSTTVNGVSVNGYCGFSLRSGNATNSPSDFNTGARFYLYFLNGNSPSTLYVYDGNPNSPTSLTGTSFSNLGRDSITNAVEAEITPAADGMSYHLVLKDVVKNQVLYILDSVFMGGAGTEDSVALFDEETQSPGDQVYNRMQIAAPVIPPEINSTNLQPTNGSIFLPTNTQLSFEVDSFNSTVASSNVSVYLNGVLQTGSTFNTNNPTTQLLGTNNPTLAVNTFYTYTIVAQDANGNIGTNIATFNTFLSNNPCISAEDYNYSSGQYFPNPGQLAYAGLLGSNGIDYLDLDTNNLNPYRGDANTNDPLQPQLLPTSDSVPYGVYATNGNDDYQLAYTDTGSWDNYTRSFPGTPFTIYARTASSSGGSFQVNILANSTATTTNQPLAALGLCNVPNTGSSTNYSGMEPLQDIFGNTVVLNLSGIYTLQQAAIASRVYNLYYFMLVPNSSTNLLTPYISIAAPAPGATGVGLASAITFTIANRQTSVTTNTIAVFLNSTNVTSKLVLKSNAAGTAVTYTPTNNLPANTNNTIAVSFNDISNNLVSNNWTFVTGSTGGTLANAIWSGAGGPSLMNWSAATNWTGGTPGPGFSATFASPGSTTTLVTNNIVDTNFSIGELSYATNTNGFHTTYISNGVTLTVTNSTTATGYEVFQVGGYASGGTSTDNGFNLPVTNTITGSGGTLQILGNPVGTAANLLNFQIRQCATNSMMIPELVVLDMSGLGTFIANVGKMTVGQGGSGGFQSNCSARVNLAMTNTISLLRNTSGQLVVGDSSGGPNTLPTSTLNLGITNIFYFDSANVGKQKITNAVFRFNPIFTNNNANPGAYIRGSNGLANPALRVSAWNIGTVSTEATIPVTNSGTVDFSGGTVNALVGTMNVGQGGTNKNDSGSAVGTLTMTAGTFNVTNLSIGTQQATNAANVTGIVNVNGTATLISTNGGITLAHIIGNGGTGTTQGMLNITNGTFQGTIAAGGGTSTVNLNGGALMVAGTDTVGTAAARLTALNLTGGSLQLNVDGNNTTTAIVNATTVTANGGTTITITSVTNVGGSAVTVHLISYTGTDPFAGFVSQVVLPYGYSGSLVDNTGNSSIDLTLMTAPLPPSPTISSIGVINNGSLVVLNGTNISGVVTGDGYSILTSTNVALPLSSWTLLNRGTFGPNGSFSFTNATGTNGPQFYILRLP